MFAIVTLKDIARACNVSVSTVSRAFDATSRISLPVRQEILSCANEMGYTPNLIARSLKSSKTMTIAIIIPSINNSFYIEVLKHLELCLHRYGYRLLVSFVQDGVSTEKDCLEMVASAQVDGLIILPQQPDNLPYILSLQDKLKVIQLFNAPFEQIDSVVMDDSSGAEAGMRFLTARNHRRVLFAGGEDRQAGFWRAVDDAGIRREEVLTLPRKVSVSELQDAVARFQPTAVFSVSETNEAAWSAIRQLELTIPDDISLLVYDDSRWVSLVGLTAVAHDLEQIASTLVAQLMRRLTENDQTPPVHTVLQPFLIDRNSVKAI